MTIKGGRKLRHRRTKRHYRRKTKHHKRRHKKRKTRHHRGGGRPGISPRGGSPAAPFSGRWGGKMAAFPPGPMYKPSQLGKVDALYYGKLDQPLLPDPTNTFGSGVTTSHGKIKGGRKSRRGGRKSRRGGRKSRRGGRKSRRGGRKSRRGGKVGANCDKNSDCDSGEKCEQYLYGPNPKYQCVKKSSGGGKPRKGGRGRRRRGGGVSTFLSNNVPGFSDVRDVYWKGGEVLKDGYNTWFGYDKVDNTSAGVQPIGKSKDVVRPEIVDIPQKLKTGSLSAKKYTVA